MEAIRRFVMEESNLEDESIILEDTDLFEAGVLDSLLAVSLIAFCENQFRCTIETSELSKENFASLSALSQLIARKLNMQAPQLPQTQTVPGDEAEAPA